MLKHNDGPCSALGRGARFFLVAAALYFFGTAAKRFLDRYLEVVTLALRAHRTRQKMDQLVAGSRWADSGHVFATMLGRPHHAAISVSVFKDLSLLGAKGD